VPSEEIFSFILITTALASLKALAFFHFGDDFQTRLLYSQTAHVKKKNTTMAIKTTTSRIICKDNVIKISLKVFPARGHIIDKTVCPICNLVLRDNRLDWMNHTTLYSPKNKRTRYEKAYVHGYDQRENIRLQDQASTSGGVVCTPIPFIQREAKFWKPLRRRRETSDSCQKQPRRFELHQ